MITDRLNERFCKDLNLPIKIFVNPIFKSRILLYDNYYDCVKKYSDFINLVEEMGGEQKYFEYYNKVKDTAINYLNENPNMKFFAEKEDMNQFKIKNIGFPKNDIYNQNNIGKMFISFDMRKGNFTALHHYDRNIVGGKDTYEDFIGMFTNCDHIKNSKYIRQVIFGNVNPRRQVTYEQYLMDTVLTDVIAILGKDAVRFFSTDEIVVEVDKNAYEKNKTLLNEMVNKHCCNGINIRETVFVLHNIVGIDGFIKENIDIKSGDKPYEIKCVDSINMPFLLRKLNGEKIKETDAVFMYNGVRAKLIDIPEIEIPSFCVNRDIEMQEKDTEVCL